MLFHVFCILSSWLLFTQANNISALFIFVLSGLYYSHVLFVQNKQYKLKWLLPSQLFTALMFFYVFIGSLMIYTGTLFYDRFHISLFNDANIVKANCITIFASSSLWLSYLLFKRDVTNRSKSSLKGLIKRNYKKRLLWFFVIAIAVRYLGVLNNVTGYGSDSSFISQVVDVFSDITSLVLIIYYITYHNQISNKVDYKFISMVLLLIMLGFMSASKSVVISPIVSIILTDYYLNKNFNKKIIGIGLIVFVLSFAIVPVVRNNINQDVDKYEDVNIRNIEAVDAFQSFLFRITYVPQLILSINYEGDTPDAVDNLWQYHLLSPIYALVPRFIYPDKPIITFGSWFSFNVYGSTENNNIGATYQGILYLSGGFFSVFLGFIILGLVQAYFVRLLFNERFLPIYLSVLPILFMLPQEPWLLYVRLIQSTLVFFITYKVITR